MAPLTYGQLPALRPDRTVKTPDGTATILARQPLLYCYECGAEYSANPADYWNVPTDQPCLCECGADLALVDKRTVYEEVQLTEDGGIA